MNIKEAREIYSEDMVRQIYNLCPGCGADNVPMPFDWLTGTALKICPICKTDRTPSPVDECQCVSTIETFK